MNEYKEDHPLHGRDAEWIAAMAEHTAGLVAPPRSRSVNLYWESFSALVHEHKRLKSIADKAPGEHYELVCKIGNAIDYPLGAPLFCERRGIVGHARNLREERDTLKASAPPTDWLTRAIEASGAPESSDWAGLLEAIDWLYAKENENETHLEMRDWKRKAEGLEARIDRQDKDLRSAIGDNVKFRKRAETAEARVAELEAATNPQPDAHLAELQAIRGLLERVVSCE